MGALTTLSIFFILPLVVMNVTDLHQFHGIPDDEILVKFKLNFEYSTFKIEPQYRSRIRGPRSHHFRILDPDGGGILQVFAVDLCEKKKCFDG
jgi:hypothetical protein